MIPRTIGLTTLEIKRPNLNHSLLNTVSEDGAVIVKIAIVNAIRKNKTAKKIKELKTPYAETIKNTPEKNHPNLRLDGKIGVFLFWRFIVINQS